MPHRFSFLSILLAVCALATQAARADGGGVIAQNQVDGMVLTVFASPAPLRAGPSDISVMLQDAESGEPILDRSVRVSIAARDESAGKAWIPPCCSMDQADDLVPATHAAAQNKLLYAANVAVPASGPVGLMVHIDQNPPFVAQLSALPAPSPAAAYWPYLALPPVAIGLFALNRRARRR